MRGEIREIRFEESRETNYRLTITSGVGPAEVGLQRKSLSHPFRTRLKEGARARARDYRFSLHPSLRAAELVALSPCISISHFPRIRL